MQNIVTNVDWQDWVRRWDRMQERYLVARSDRFDIIAGLVVDTQQDLKIIVDLGCGTGSLSNVLLEAAPSVHVIGLDMDPTLLPLAKARTANNSDRVSFIQADLRDKKWVDLVSQPVDAVVSATALHWLNEQHLATLYHQLAAVLNPGGIFLNADHVASESGRVQKSWEARRAEMLDAHAPKQAENWDMFWRNYLDTLGPEAAEARAAALGEWEGIEEGLPLSWHLDQLRTVGFTAVDCFWRCDCDAIYGGLKN
jgi:trans-aconitate methyltransferase